MQREKVRIFALAHQLDMESKDLVALCRQNGIDVKSLLSTIEPEVRDQIVQLVQNEERFGIHAATFRAAVAASRSQDSGARKQSQRSGPHSAGAATSATHRAPYGNSGGIQI